jgi:hypothetical protein
VIRRAFCVRSSRITMGFQLQRINITTSDNR